MRYSSTVAPTEITAPNHSTDTASMGAGSNRSACVGSSARHSTSTTASCKGSTRMGGCAMRFCAIAPSVMQARAASAQATPATDTRACSRLSSTTRVRPPSATSSPAMRNHEARRSCSSSVAIGCTPRMVASAPGVRPWSSARK